VFIFDGLLAIKTTDRKSIAEGVFANPVVSNMYAIEDLKMICKLPIFAFFFIRDFTSKLLF